MVNHEQQDGTADVPSTSPSEQLTPKGASRRRVAGLGVSGVLMTVASNNAMANLVCKSPSGALSGNLNSNSPNVTCEGRSPGYWKQHPAAWPAEVKTNDRFAKLFPCHGQLSGATCMQVLEKHDADKHNVAMHLMATYLNVVDKRISFLTRQAVIDMWADWEQNGSYTPAVGATPWTGEQLTNYLSSTQRFSD